MIESVALIVYIAGLVTMVVLSLAGKVQYSLMLLVPLIPLQNVIYRFHRYPLGKDFMDIVIIAMLAGWVFKTMTRGERLFAPTPLNTIVVLTMLYTFYGLIRGSFYLDLPLPLSPGDIRLQTWKNYMLLPLLFFIAANNVTDAGQVKRLLLFMFLAMLLVDFYTGKQIRYMTSVASRDRLVGTFVWLGPNQVAAYYVESILMMTGLLAAAAGRFSRLVLAGLITLGVGITLFLYSRGAYIALFTGLMTIAFLKKRIWLVPLVLIVVAWQTVLPQSVIDRIKETRTADGTLDSSSAKRLELWREAWGMFTSNPVTGVGFDVIYANGLKYGFKDTHNIYLKVLAEQGLIGMGLFLSLLFTAFASGVRLFRRARDPLLQGVGLGFAAATVGAMTTNLFGDRWTFLQIGAYYWVFMGLVARGLLIADSEAYIGGPVYEEQAALMD
jgi:O-antigen ligase